MTGETSSPSLDWALTKRLPYAVVMAVIALSVLAPDQVARHQAWPLLASMAVVGLPHGAADHLVPVWARAARLSAVYLCLFFAAYLACAALVWALWLISPLLGTVYFLAITVWHWGSADATDALPRQTLGAVWAARSLSRGGLIVAGPIAAHFAAASAVIASLALAFHAHLPPPVGLQLAARVVVLAAILVELWLAVVNREWRLAGETCLLCALIASAPPLVSIGVYFLGWHSLRHLARLVSLREATKHWSWRQLGATYLTLMPLTVAALALLVGMGVYLRVRLNPSSVLAVYLILISALTFPHALVTGWLDWRERSGKMRFSATPPYLRRG